MNFLKKYYAYLTGLAVFIIYLFTVAPTVIQIDSGELAAVQSTGGIAHPTGYPLFTVLGFIFTNLPLPFSKILMANLLAALWCSLAVLFFASAAKYVFDNQLFFEVEKRVHVKKTKHSSHAAKHSKKSVQQDSPSFTNTSIELKQLLSAVLGAFVLAFSKTFWFQSTSVEVYSLHVFLISLIILFMLRAYVKNRLKDWIIFSILLALGFSNHMTTLLILPGTAFLFFEKNRFSAQSFKRIGIMVLVFIPVLAIIYSYLPLRAMQNPPINWGNPIDFERIFRHISGKQYQVWLFSSTESAKKQFIYFWNNLPGEFAVIGLFFIFIGFLNSLVAARKFFIFVLINFAATILYSINYDIHDIDAYFLLAYVSLAFFAVSGIFKLFSFLKIGKLHKSPSGIPGSSAQSKSFFRQKYLLPGFVISVFILVQLYINFNKVNQNGVYIFEDYTKALIQSTNTSLNESGKRSIIFSYQWDYFISSSYYFQRVEGFSPETVIIDKELLRRSWYYNQINTNYPDVLSRMQKDVNLFLNALKPFERDEKYDADLLEKLYKNLMQKLITTNFDKYEFYIAPEMIDNEIRRGEFTIPEGYDIVPDLFLFKVVKTANYVPTSKPDFHLRFPENRNYYINFIENMVGSMLVRRTMYEMRFDKTEMARNYINKIKTDLPNYKIPPELAQVF